MTSEQFTVDYFQLLGVNRNADDETICRAFRQLSRQYHPDKVSGQEDKMKLLSKAKVTLLDPEKRAVYEANHEPDENPDDLLTDFLRLNVGKRLSDGYRDKIELWKIEYQSVRIVGNLNVLTKHTEELERTIWSNKTYFDVDSDQLIEENKSNQLMLNELETLYTACTRECIINCVLDCTQNFDNLAKYILGHQCRSALTSLYEQVKPTHGYEMPPKYKALLQIIKSSSSLLGDNHQARIRGLYEAVLMYPAKCCMKCVLQLINNRLTDANKMEVINIIMHRLLDEEEAIDMKFMQRLKNSPTLKAIIRYEKGIHRQNNEPMEKAMLYIDMCSIFGHPIVLANCFVMAAKELIAHIKENTDAAEAYAIKNCVTDLCATVLHFVSKYANPISQLKYSIHVIRLLKNVNQMFANFIGVPTSFKANKRAKSLISELDECVFKLANHCVSKSIRVSPFIDTTLDMSSDVLYIDVINDDLLENYYQWNINTYPGHPLVHLYQYSLMEGSWKGWFNEAKFGEYRNKCIMMMLGKTNMTELSVSKMMKPEISRSIPKPAFNTQFFNFLLGNRHENLIELKPMINRCEEGWMDSTKNYLNMGQNSFNSVDGFIIDLEQGTFEIFVSCDKSIGPLCDSQDIDEIIIKGLSHSVFSLDQADYELDYHPFQLMRFAPKRLENSRYLATLLAADYLLKMIATNTEVSAQPPFEFKKASDGFLKALPTDLREFIMMKKDKMDFGKVHRFWIENGEIPCYEHGDDNGKRTFEFYYTPMVVKKHLMKQNEHGELVDDSDDSEDDLTDDSGEEEDECDEEIPPRQKISAEAQFARRLTQYYDLIGCHFPVLLRIRELAKLNAISKMLQGTYHMLEEKKRELTISRDKIHDLLVSIRREITYPVCTEDRINELYWKTLRSNNVYDESRVEWSERNRVKNKIRSDLNDAERKLFTEIPKQLAKSFDLINTEELARHIRNWIMNGWYNDLVGYLCEAIREKQLEDLSKFGNNLKKLGINLTPNDSTELDESDSACKWVPAAFSQVDGRRVYGGVALLPKLNAQSTKGFQGFQSSAGDKGGFFGKIFGGSSDGASGGGGSSGGNSGNNNRFKQPSQREQVMNTYGNGKGWPQTPIRVSDTYFGRPGTAHKTHQGIIIKFGPSGWPQIHNPRYSTRKAAIQASGRASRGCGNKNVISDDAHGKSRVKRGTATEQQKRDYHNKNKKGDHNPHFHSTDKKGDKLKDGVHHLY